MKPAPMADDALTRKEAEMDRMKDSELLGTTDGRVWAQQFNLVFANLYPGGPLDEGWLIGWFANAIETGRSAGQRSLESVREEVLEEAAWSAAKEVCGTERREGGFIVARAVSAALQHAPTRVAEGCVHEWADATNHVVSGTEICLKCFELRGMSAPESPAKELPGEQNAAPQASAKLTEPLDVPCGVGPAAAAPDVAAMVKRLAELPWPKLIYPDEAEMRDLGYAALPLLQELPALIKKLGQGWIPALESESKGVFLTGIPGKPIYAVDERAEPYCWWRFDLPDLPPSPERP